MYFVVIFSILIAVSAGKGLPLSGLPTYPMKTGHSPEHCCAPEQYTHSLSGNIAKLYLGELFAIFGRSRGAYDSINQLIGSETIVDFSNGTEDIMKNILDFKKHKGFYITKVKDVVQCYKFEIPPVKFPYNCLPDDAVFIGSATLGDRALLADQWYVSLNDTSTHETFHIVYSVKREGCVDLGSSKRIFDSQTGAEIRSEVSNWYDFKLGIDDPDRWFTPPPECEASKVTKLPARLRHTPMYGGKVILFN